jgi:hypothetical protein
MIIISHIIRYNLFKNILIYIRKNIIFNNLPLSSFDTGRGNMGGGGGGSDNFPDPCSISIIELLESLLLLFLISSFSLNFGSE